MTPEKLAVRHPLYIVAALLLVFTAVQATAAEEVTISFMHWGTAEYAERYASLIDAFEAAHPDIKIEQLHTPEEYKTKLLAMFAGGTPPDTFVLDMQDTAYYGQLDVLVDLLPLAERDASYHFDELIPGVVDIMTYRGQVLGLPADAGPNVYYYNADLFDAAGLPYPDQQYAQGGWTWDDFRQAAIRLTRREGDGRASTMGAEVHRGGALHRLWMWSNGAPEFDDIRSPTRALYDSPASIQTFEFLQNLMHTDQVASVSNADTGDMNPSDAFSAGVLAMMARWTTGIPYFADSEVRFGIAPYPKGPGPNGRHTADLATSGFAIAKASKHQEAAWQWVRFATSREGQAIVPGSEGPALATRPGIEPEFFPPNMVNPELMLEMLRLPNNGNHVRLLAPEQGDIHRIINEGLSKIWSGEAAPASVLPGIVDQVNAFLSGDAKE